MIADADKVNAERKFDEAKEKIKELEGECKDFVDKINKVKLEYQKVRKILKKAEDERDRASTNLE